MRHATLKTLWIAVKDLLATILNSLYTGPLPKFLKLDIELEEEDVRMPKREDEYLGI